MLFVDANAFLGKSRGGPIDISSDTLLDFCIATASPPFTLPPNQVVRPLTMAETLEKIHQFKTMISEQSRLSLVLNRDDLIKARVGGKIGVVLGLQNTPSGVNVRNLFEAGVRVMALAYYEENDLGSGFLNGGIGLKNFGEEVVEQCAMNGIIMDLSHVGHQTALDTLSFIKTYALNCHIMASHSGCVSKYHHMRNILDKTMRGIVELGGMVGITTITFNLSEGSKKIVGSFINHLEHMVQICGNNSVVIGTDAIYGIRTPEEGRKEMEILAPRADPLNLQGIRFPETIYEGPKLMKKIYEDLTASIYPYTSFALHDLSHDVVEGVMGKNLLNFFERALPA